MAVIIPCDGYKALELVAPPDGAERTPYALMREFDSRIGDATILPASGPDGSEWWVAVGVTSPVNERGARFMQTHGVRVTGEVRGPVLYVSAAERGAAPLGPVVPGKPAPAAPAPAPLVNGKPDPRQSRKNRGPIPSGWVPVRGDTFPVKEQLKALGARWDVDSSRWFVPPSLLPQAETIVKAGPRARGPGPGGRGPWGPIPQPSSAPVEKLEVSTDPYDPDDTGVPF